MTVSERRALAWIILILLASTGTRAAVEVGHDHGLQSRGSALTDSLLEESEARLAEAELRARPVSSDTPLDLNREGEAGLDRLPGVGPALAARIVAFRVRQGPFDSVGALEGVRGIGPATLERLRPFLVVLP